MTPRARRVILSSSSEASESEIQVPQQQQQKQGDIIDLSESPPLKPKPLPTRAPSHTKPNARSQYQSLYADDSDSGDSDSDDSNVEDGSILFL